MANTVDIELEIQSNDEPITLEIAEGVGGGTRNYNQLINKPQINGVELIGDKSFEDLGLVNADEDTDGLMSSEDYVKLSGIEEGAQANVQADWTQSDSTSDDYIKNKPTLGTASAKNYTSSVTDGSTDLVESGAVHDAIASAISSVYKPSGDKTVAELVSSLLVVANLGNVYNMTDSGTTTADFVGGAGKPINIGDNVAIVDVGSGTYKFDLLSGMVDLSNYYNKTETNTLLDGKVDKVAGKGLSTNDYTTDEKNKLGGIESGAEVNVQADWNVSDSSSDAYIQNKPRIYIPTAICETLGNVADKVAVASDYVIDNLQYGGRMFQLVMLNENTAVDALMTLNVGGTGAKPLYVNGSRRTELVTRIQNLPRGTYFVYYDGTNYYLRTDGKITALGVVNTSNEDLIDKAYVEKLLTTGSVILAPNASYATSIIFPTLSLPSSTVFSVDTDIPNFNISSISWNESSHTLTVAFPNYEDTQVTVNYRIYYKTI